MRVLHRQLQSALAHYNNGNYQAALELLRGINETNPGFPVVQELLAEARAKADAAPASANQIGEVAATAGEDGIPPTRASGLPPVVLYAGGAVLLLVIVVLLVLLLARKKKVVPAVQTAGQAPAPVLTCGQWREAGRRCAVLRCLAAHRWCQHRKMPLREEPAGDQFLRLWRE